MTDTTPVPARRGEQRIKLPVLRCLRCEHSWYPRHTEPPKRCPKCGSPYWDKPRR